MVAGLQLTSIGSLRLTEWRLWIAVAGALVALGGVAYVIGRTSQLLTDDWITLAQLSDQDFDDLLDQTTTVKDVVESIESYKDVLYAHVASSIEQLSKRLADANAATGEAIGGASSRTSARIRDWVRCTASSINGRAPERDGVRAAELQQAARNVVQYANYYATRRKFKALYPQLGRAAGVTVIGVLLFAYAANPPKPATPSSPVTQQRSPTPAPSSTPTTTPAPASISTPTLKSSGR
jgi:hypothetical protein